MADRSISSMRLPAAPKTYDEVDQRVMRQLIEKHYHPDSNLTFLADGVGAVVRTVVDKLQEAISVKDFGAEGNGVSDDTAAIQRALDVVYAAGGGIVKVPLGKYYVTSGLHMYQSVQLIGDGGGKEDHIGGGGGGETGTQFIFNPVSADTFLTVMRDPAGLNPGSPTNAVCAAFGVRNDGPSGSDGIYFINASFICRDVWMQGFAGGRCFRVVGAINSAFEQCLAIFSGWGFFMDPGGILSTTLALRGVYCASNNINYVVQHVLGFSADAETISESPVSDGWWIDNAARVTLARVYTENIAGYVVLVGSQNNGTTTDLVIDEFNYSTGVANDVTKDMIYLQHADGVRIGIFNPPPERASFVRSTVTCANVVVTAPYGGLYTNQRTTPGSFRASSHAYTKGTLFKAVGDDGVTRTYIVAAAGTTAGSQPLGYGTGTLNLADGGAGISRYMTSTEWPVIDESLGLLSGWTDERVRRVIGAGAPYTPTGTEFSVTGWGLGVSGACSARDTGGRLILTAGTFPAANPTVTLTAFKDGPWHAVPVVVQSRGDLSAPTTGYWALTALSATSLTWTFVGTPIAASAYVLDWMVSGK